MPNLTEPYPIYDRQGVDALISEYDDLYLDDDEALCDLSDIDANRMLDRRLHTLRIEGRSTILKMEEARKAWDALEYLSCLDAGMTLRDERLVRPDYAFLKDVFMRHTMKLTQDYMAPLESLVTSDKPRVAQKARVCAYYGHLLRDTVWYDGLPQDVKTFSETYVDAL